MGKVPLISVSLFRKVRLERVDVSGKGGVLVVAQGLKRRGEDDVVDQFTAVKGFAVDEGDTLLKDHGGHDIALRKGKPPKTNDV